jgi:predicted amidohydrolase
MNKVRIGIVNLSITNSVGKNTKKILQYLKKAKNEGVDILCFPEFSLTGIENTITKNNDNLKLISEKTKEYSLNTIVCGYLKTENGRYNSAILADEKGLRKFYYKRNPWKEKISKGKNNLIFDIGDYKCGVLICWDAGDPGIVKSVVEKGAEIVFCPSYWEGVESLDISKNKDILRSMCITRASDNGIIFALSNALGKSSIDYSCIASPEGIEKEIQKREELVYFDVYKNKIRQYRGNQL